MTRQSHEAAADISEDFEIPEDFKADCIMAMRLALEADGAPARCSNRNCRRTGRCHAVAEGDAPLCHAGIPGHVAATAALMITFADQLAEVVCAPVG